MLLHEHLACLLHELPVPEWELRNQIHANATAVVIKGIAEPFATSLLYTELMHLRPTSSMQHNLYSLLCVTIPRARAVCTVQRCHSPMQPIGAMVAEQHRACAACTLLTCSALTTSCSGGCLGCRSVYQLLGGQVHGS